MRGRERERQNPADRYATVTVPPGLAARKSAGNFSSELRMTSHKLREYFLSGISIRDRIDGRRGEIVMNSSVENSSGLLLLSSAPLLEEERNVGLFALVAD